MSGTAPEIFIGRQPILDRKEHIVAYELLFRSSADALTAEFDEIEQASARVIVNTFGGIDIREVLGDCRGFFNLSRTLLMTDLPEALPKDRAVLEILEGIEVDSPLYERCKELSELGYTLALDDYVVDDSRSSLVEMVDCVKVDLTLVDPKQLPRLVKRLRRSNVTLLAEKVESEDEFRRCRRLGFDLFQGYYFARPSVISATALDPARVTLMKILSLLGGNFEFDALHDCFKHNVELGINLLRLVNSVGLEGGAKIDTVRHAIVYMGHQQLQRWLTLLLYATRGSGDSYASPLLQTAALRGRLMELMIRARGGKPNQELEDRAFLTGMLSLVDALLHASMDEILIQLNVAPEVSNAILHRQGELGELLHLTEMVENLDVEGASAFLESWHLKAEQLVRAQLQASIWLNRLRTEIEA